MLRYQCTRRLELSYYHSESQSRDWLEACAILSIKLPNGSPD